MADLSRLVPDDGDRGQLILIAAFILAVSFVVLALVVNSAIFTENLATREDMPGSHDALDHRYEVEQSVGELVMAINGNNSDGSTIGDIDDNIGTQGGSQQASLGRVVSISHDSQEDGLKIAQDNFERNFTNIDGNESWTVAEGVSQTRNFGIDLNLTDEDILDDITSDPFTVIVNDTDADDQWNLSIGGDNILNDGVEIEVETIHGETATCTGEVEDNNATVDITGATVAGEPCHALSKLQDDGTEMWFGANIDEYDIEFENADNIEGTYSFIISDGDYDDDDDFGDDEEQFPYDDDAIYSVTVDYAYYTHSVGYETQIRVAPGEVPP